MEQGILRVGTAVVMLLGIGPFALAQGGPPGPSPQGGFGPRGPRGLGGDTFVFRGLHGGFGGKTITGAPFTATLTINRLQTLSDGNTISNKTTGTIARDSAGRTRREFTLPAIGPLAASGTAAQLAFITDPVAQMNYILDQNKKTAQEFAIRPHNMAKPPRMGNQPAPPNSNAQTTESLGTKDMEGLTLQGTRITRTIPAGQLGNANPIVSTLDRWYSPDLQLTVSETRTDPRFGTTIYQLTNIKRQEPDASLFTVPSDYTVTQGRSFLKRPGGPRSPAPNQE